MKIIIKGCLIVALIVIIAQSIGPIAFHVGSAKITLLPMLFAVVIGMVMTTNTFKRIVKPFGKIFKKEDENFASKMVGICLLVLGTKYAGMIIPNIDLILDAGLPLLVQELGNLLPVFIAVPIAVKLGMGRQAIGAGSSISREPSIAVISEKYGIESQEGMGVLAIYLCGSVIGTIWFSILGSIAPLSGLHPMALGAGAGVGSGSMLSAASSSLIVGLDPEMADKVLAIAATSNLLSSVLGAISLTFLGIPLANMMYRLVNKDPSQVQSAGEVK
jgi:hypothetical protein